MANLETVDFCYHGESPSPTLLRYIARKSSIRRQRLRELTIVPLNFWSDLGKLRGSDAVSISGLCTARPGSTRPRLVTSVNFQSNSSVQFFVAYPSPWLACLLIDLEVLEGEGN